MLVCEIIAPPLSSRAGEKTFHGSERSRSREWAELRSADRHLSFSSPIARLSIVAPPSRGWRWAGPGGKERLSQRSSARAGDGLGC